MDRRYTALRTIATIYKIFGVIVAVITVLSTLGVCASILLGGSTLSDLGGFGDSGPAMIIGGLVLILSTILGGGGMALTFYALGEGINLLIALEENTRMTAAMLAGPR